MRYAEEMDHLSKIKLVLNNLTEISVSEPSYDIMSNSIYWKDELPPRSERTPIRSYQALRSIFRFRTSLIVGVPDEHLRVCWNFAVENFPNWVGFSSQRCEKNPDLEEIFNSLKCDSERKSEAD